MRAHRSPIWKMPLDQLKQIVNQSKTIREILSHFGLENKGSNHKTLKQRLAFEDINWDHVPKGLGHNKGKKYPGQYKNKLEHILVRNSHYNRYHLKKRLLSESLLENKCCECGIGAEWNGKKLSLQLDHKNGISNDNRLENLRMLCPNCHSQTGTFAGKNKHYGRNNYESRRT